MSHSSSNPSLDEASTASVSPWYLAWGLASLVSLAPACGYGTLTVWSQGSDDSSQTSSSDDAERDDTASNPTLSPGSTMPSAEVCEDLDQPPSGPAPARLLTNYEYEHTVRDLLGYDGDVSEVFPAENKVDGFENNARAHVASRLRVRKFMKAAETISKRTVENRLDAILPCNPLDVGEQTCGHRFVASLLERAFRRPPSDAAVSDFRELFDSAHADHGFIEALEMVIQATLQSPQFLYRLEFVDGANTSTTRPVGDWEMATRLSYFLWASAPDAELRRAARRGELSTQEQIEAQARRMLDDPKAKRAVYQFHRQWLGMDGLDSVVKDGDRFSSFESQMTDDWKTSLRRFVTDAYFGPSAGFEYLMTSSNVHLSDRLARLYGREDLKRNGRTDPYRFDSERRAGLLTQPGLMALLANANQSSPIRRGVWVREQLLCQHLPAPPQNQMITPPDPDPNATTREKFRQHTANPQCAGCHELIDPIGFGFEHYDSLGRWRRRDSGHEVDATGRLADVPKASLEGSFEGAVELSERLEKSKAVRHCLASRWFKFAMGRAPSTSEKCSLYRVRRAFVESGGDFHELLITLATSNAFRYRRVATSNSKP